MDLKIKERFLTSMTDIKNQEAFESKLGFTVNHLLEIGFDKYEKAMGWTKPSQVDSWKTDQVAIIICPECRNDFGAWPIELGVCNKCAEKFNSRLKYVSALNDLERLIDSNLLIDKKMTVSQFFYMSKDVRKEFSDYEEDAPWDNLLRMGALADVMHEVLTKANESDTMEDIKDQIFNAKSAKQLHDIISITIDHIIQNIEKEKFFEDTEIKNMKPSKAFIICVYIVQHVSEKIKDITLKELKELSKGHLNG